MPEKRIADISRIFFKKNLTTAKKLKSPTFFGFKIDYTQSYESWLILTFSVFLDVNSQKANQCLSTLILPAFLAHCPCLRAKHFKWAIVQHQKKFPCLQAFYFFKNAKELCHAFPIFGESLICLVLLVFFTNLAVENGI